MRIDFRNGIVYTPGPGWLVVADGYVSMVAGGTGLALAFSDGEYDYLKIVYGTKNRIWQAQAGKSLHAVLSESTGDVSYEVGDAVQVRDDPPPTGGLWRNTRTNRTMRRVSGQWVPVILLTIATVDAGGIVHYMPTGSQSGQNDSIEVGSILHGDAGIPLRNGAGMLTTAQTVVVGELSGASMRIGCSGQVFYASSVIRTGDPVAICADGTVRRALSVNGDVADAVAENDAPVGGTVTVRTAGLLSGVMTIPDGAKAGTTLFIAPGGGLTDVRPKTGVCQAVGRVWGATAYNVWISQAVKLQRS
jgi:hypothetical protein